MKKTLICALGAATLLLTNTLVYAESLIDGVYLSPSDENGRGACRLTVTSLGEETKYGDQLFMIESSGEGACEWSAIGVSKNYAVTAGSVTSGGVQTFVKLTFPFGPAGKRLQLIAYDDDGSVRNEAMLMKDDQALLTAE